MESIGEVALTTLTFFGHTFSINPITIIMTWVIMALLLLLSFGVTRKLGMVPNKVQSLLEVIFKFLEEIILSTLGQKDGKKFMPLIFSLFMFILLSNWIGVIPNFFGFFGTIIAVVHKALGGDVTIIKEGLTNIMITPPIHCWYSFLFHIHGIEEPTKFLSTDLSLALVVFFVAQGFGIKSKGLFGYFKGFMEPLPDKGLWLWFFWLNPFFYLNIISQFANTLSHCFRLFGNIFGGGIIIIIVSELLRYFLMPVGLLAFFGLFAGAIQAFVFTMLAISYIAQQK